MAEQNKNNNDMENTRRELFIQELLDNSRKNGDILDARTMRLPEIPHQSKNTTDGSDQSMMDDAELEQFLYETSTDDLLMDQPLLEEDPDSFFAEDAVSDDSELFRPQEEPEWEDDILPETSGGLLLPSLKIAIYAISVLLAAVLLALGVWLAADDVFGLTDGDRAVTVEVTETGTMADISERLKTNGLIKYKTLFRIYCALTDAERKIDPGVYELNDYFDYMALVNGMIANSGIRKTVTITIPEGYESAQILRLLAEQGAAEYDDLCEVAANYPFEYAFLADVPFGEENRLEGYLFPDTYEFYVGDDAEKVLNKFLKNFENKFTDDLYQQLDELNETLKAKGYKTTLTLRDVLSVASMIEKEAATTGERTSLSSVIYNRLCSSLFPHLQIDATVQYALAERKEVLNYDDLKVDSPYNTYLCEGLPAGPIACPGLSSIKAALYPAQTEFYYYALDRDGTHHFSKTRLEHEQFLASLEETP